MDHLTEIANTIPFLVKLENLLNNSVAKEHILIIYVIVNLILTSFKRTVPISNILLLIFPIHDSLNSFQKPLVDTETLRNQLLFFLIFSILLVLDFVTSFITSLIPLFYCFRFVFLFALAANEKNLCNMVRENVLKRIPINNIGKIKLKNAMQNANKLAKEKLDEIRRSVSNSDVFKPKIGGEDKIRDEVKDDVVRKVSEVEDKKND